MIAPLLLYLAVLLAGRAAATAFEFDWTLCDKESACFIGGRCDTTLKTATAKPAAPCDVTLSIRPYNVDMKTFLVRVLLQGAAIDYGKGVSLSIGGIPKLSCSLKAGKPTLDPAMDDELISSNVSGANLYCEFIVRRSEAILPATLPPPPSPLTAAVTYWDSGAPQTVKIVDYPAFYKAVQDAVTCDPSLIKFDRLLRGINETTRQVSTLRHATSCSPDPPWELAFESPRDKGRTEPASVIRCEQDKTSLIWTWKVAKKGGSSQEQVTGFRAHCVTSTCLLCSKPPACTEVGCVNAEFRPGEKTRGGVSCADISCPSDRLLAAANKTAAQATCVEVSPLVYKWTIDGTAVETIHCVERPTIALPPTQQPIIGDLMVVGVSAGILALGIIGIVIFCICTHLRRKNNSKAQSTARIPDLSQMHTGRTPDSDQDNFAVAATRVLTKTGTNSSENKTGQAHAKSESKKESTSAENVGKGTAQGKKPNSPRLKKKSSSSSKTSKKGKRSGKSGKSKTDVEGETEDDKKSKERTESREREETDRQSNERIPQGPIKKYEPDHTPYESLINYEGLALDGLKGKDNQKKGKSTRALASKRNAKDTATRTENSAKDKTKDPSRPASLEDDKPSLEQMREREHTSKEDLSNKENDDKTQSGVSRPEKKKK